MNLTNLLEETTQLPSIKNSILIKLLYLPKCRRAGFRCNRRVHRAPKSEGSARVVKIRIRSKVNGTRQKKCGPKNQVYYIITQLYRLHAANLQTQARAAITKQIVAYRNTIRRRDAARQAAAIRSRQRFYILLLLTKPSHCILIS